MANLQVIYSDIVVKEDIPRLGKAEKLQVSKAIFAKLTISPNQFGKPLRKPHQGYLGFESR